MIETGTILRASDGNLYRFEGAQWKLFNEKTGRASRIATFKIAFELERESVKEGKVISKSFFGQIYEIAKRKKSGGLYSQETREWLKELGDSAKGVGRVDILNEESRAKNKLTIGKLYFYQYRAKGFDEKTIPYWDAFPCVFPFEMKRDGFLGLNLHYLPYPLRANLFDALFNLIRDKKISKKSKLPLSYEILKRFSEFSLVKPTIHRYLATNVESQFIEVECPLWAYALFLPLQNFRDGKTGRVIKNIDRVYTDSEKRIK